MRGIPPIFVGIGIVVVLGCTLGLSQQSGSTNVAGGGGGSQFADPEPAAGTRIAAVRVWAGDVIDGIQLVYATSAGANAAAGLHGRTGGRPNVFTLDLDEYITGISGQSGDTIDALRIHTNKKTSPTYGGSGGGREFQLIVPNGSFAVGFIGRSGEAVDAIGLIYRPLPRRAPGRISGVLGNRNIAAASKYPLTQLFGGDGGDPFVDQDIPSGAQIAEVRISAGETVDSVQVVYLMTDGRTVDGERHGGSGGREGIFRLDSDEFITGISGRFGDTIDSLRIQTNKRISPPYGGSGGSRNFRVDVPSGNYAIGFFGRSGDTLDAIGLVYTPVPRRGTGFFGAVTGGGALGSGSYQYSQTQLAGGRGGNPFVDQNIPAGARIGEFHIFSGDTVDSVQLVYLLPNGRTVAGTRHGGSGGREQVFRLDSDEYVIGISGRCGETIDSLQIQTNKRTSPMFGGSGGARDYRIDVPAGNQAIGLAGRAGQTLDAIGLAYTRAGLRR